MERGGLGVWFAALVFAFATANWGQVAFAAKTIRVNGVATNTDGTALAGGTVILVDNGGHQSSVVANNHGKFKIDVTGFTLPFLLQSTPAGGTPLFYGYVSGTGTIGSNPTANVTVYTDLILNLILNAAGTTTLAEFTAPTGLPNASQVQSIAPTIQNLISHWLSVDKVSSKNFSFSGLHFSAGKSKFGRVLTQTCSLSSCGGNAYAGGSETFYISDAKSETNQTVIFTSSPPLSPGSGFAPFSAQSTTAVSGVVTASLMSKASIPVTASGSDALDGVNQLLNNLQTTVNLRGGKLADTDLIGYFDPAYLRGGQIASVAAGAMASNIRKMKMNNTAIKVFHWTSTDTADPSQTDVNAAWGYDLNGVSQSVVNEIFRCDASSNCLFYGNQQIAQTPGAVQLQQLTTSDLTSATPTTQTSLAVNVTAPEGTIKSVTVSDDSGTTYYNNQSIPLLDQLVEKTFPSPGNEVDIVQDQFFLWGPLVGGNSQPAIPPAGTVFDVTLTDQSNSATIYTSIVDGSAGEPVNLISPAFSADHSIGAAPLGKSATFKWKLPTSYTTDTISLSGVVQSAGCTSALSFATAKDLGATATSAKVNVPKQIATPGDIAQVTVNLTIRGLEGETGRLLYVWGHC